MIFRGVSACPGIAVGKAIVISHGGLEIPHTTLNESGIEDEIRRFRESLEKARINILELQDHTRKIFGEELASVFLAHRMFLEDEVFIEKIETVIMKERVNAEWAVYVVTEEIKSRLKQADDTYLSERVVDLEDVARQLLSAMGGESHNWGENLEEDSIIVGHDIPPSDLARYASKKIVGYVIETGGRTSHTSIMARALGIPTVIGVSNITRTVGDKDTVIVDGSEGKVVVSPDESIIAEYENKKDRYRAVYRKLEREGRGKPKTLDGVDIHLMANLELTSELPLVKRYGAEGIGLYRSEFLYLTMSPNIPNEEDHYKVYTRLLTALAPKPVVIRTFDLGGRKLARETLHLLEDNPVLGMRGIRLCLNSMEIFRPQLRALLRAGVKKNLRILLPMVSGVNEIRQTRALLSSLADELEQEGKPYSRDVTLGMMVEIPSAAIIAEKFVPEVDFIAIGTNDLIQYTLAVDRNNERVGYLYEPLHPSILSLIKGVVDKAKPAECKVSVCGEMAADPLGSVALLGLGVDILSMEPSSIPIIKDTLKKIELGYVRELMDKTLSFSTAKEVTEFLMESFATKIPGGLFCPLQ